MAENGGKDNDVLVQVPKKKHKTILSCYFPETSQPSRRPEPSSNVAEKPSLGTKKNPKQHIKSTTSTRTATPATMEKWKTELAVHNVSEWLQYGIDTNGKVNKMNCKLCISYSERIKDMTNFSDIWIVGSTNYKKSAVEEHATKCKPHSKAHDLFLKSKGTSAGEETKVWLLLFPIIDKIINISNPKNSCETDPVP